MSDYLSRLKENSVALETAMQSLDEKIYIQGLDPLDHLQGVSDALTIIEDELYNMWRIVEPEIDQLAYTE